MSERLILLTSFSVILLYISYEFSMNSHANTVVEVVDVLLADWNFKGIVLGSVGIFLGYCLWIIVKYLFSYRRYYAQRISVKEYETQKQTYTQVKVNELLNSPAYQEYIQKNRLS